MSASHRGKKFTDEHRAKIAAANRNRVVSDETRARIAAAKRGRPHAPLSAESREKISRATRGVPRPHMAGENNPNWRGGLFGESNGRWLGGITPEHRRLRNSREHQEWARAVKERDNWTCQMCGRRGGDMHADHIKPFSLYPELRFDPNNGRTLCPSCHRKHGARGTKKEANVALWT